MPRLLTDTEIDEQLSGLPDWRRSTSDGDSAIQRSYEREDFAAAIGLVRRIADVAEELNHHPDIDVRWNRVDLVLSTHSEGGLTQLDIEAAHRFDALGETAP